jgi:EmrB/QacA subfamily drug resistance transporter
MTTTVPTPPTAPPLDGWPGGHPLRRQILVVLCASLLVVVIDNTVLNTALPTLARALHAGTSTLQWIVDAYTVCFAALLVPAGALGDRFGRRRTLVAGLAVFAASSLAAAFAPGSGLLVADRVVMGVGAALVMPSTLSILTDVFPPAERPGAIGAWSAVVGVGVVLGPTVGGLLLAHFFWGSVFVVNVPLSLLALAGVVLVVPESADSRPRPLDLVGSVLAAAGLVTVVDAIIEAPGRGWTSPVTLALAAGGVVALASFVAWELRVDHPLLDLRVFASRSFSASAGAVTVIFFSLFGSLFAFTQYLQLVHGYSPLSAGVRALPFALAMGATSPVSTVLARRVGSRPVVTGGLLLMAAGLTALSTVSVGTTYPVLAAAVAVMGAGMGLVMAPASTTIMAVTPPGQAGAGSAVNDTIREVGGALGVAAVGSVTAARFASVLRPQLLAHRAPAALTRAATSSIAAADAVGRHVGGPAGRLLVDSAHQAYVRGMASGIRAAAGVALLGALAACIALPGRRSGGLATLEVHAESAVAA